MAKKLSFSIAVNLLTENFRKGATTVRDNLRSIQMQCITFAAALGAGGMGLAGLVTRFKDVVRETSRALTSLKNVSAGTKGFADNLRFTNDMSAKYGQNVNILTGNFAKFTASATQANMPMEQQKKVFESLSRASTAFGLSADDTNGVFLALSQMMSKGKISSEELRKQMGERIPIAMQAMAKAAGVSMAGLEKLMKQGKLLSADVIPKFADALNNMIPNVDTDNLETSVNRLGNAFEKIANASGFQDKYKSLVDGLTALLEVAGKNIQNIIIGVVGAIGFVVANSLTKTVRGYKDTGTQIIESVEKTATQLKKVEAARVKAETELKAYELAQEQATGTQKIALAKKVAAQKQLLELRTTQVTAAQTAHTTAMNNAAAIKTAGGWAVAYATIAGAAKRAAATIKAMFSAYWPALLISAITALIGWFVKLHKEANRIKNIFKEYRKEADSVGNTQEAKQLKTQLAIMNDKNKSLHETQAAQAALQKMLGKEKLSQQEINKEVEKRIQLLKTAAQADFYARKAVETEDKIRTQTSGINSRIKEIDPNAYVSDEQIKNIARIKAETNLNNMDSYWAMLNKIVSGQTNTDKLTGNQNKIRRIISRRVDEIAEDMKVLADAEKHLADASNTANALNTTVSPDDDLDNKAKREAEKRLEALRKLDDADRRRQIEKQKFDLDMQQKEIDLLDDSFEKRTRQTLLNLKKEQLEIAQAEADFARQQYDHAKNKYESIHGNDDGFEAYFKKIKAAGFKDSSGADIMPEGLRTKDITAQVSALMDAAQKAQEKGLKDINTDLSAALLEQELMFASNLDVRLAEINAYYDKERKAAEGNAELLAKLEAARQRETLTATTADNIERLDFQEQYEQERAAGMESIGMTELVEEKKLEITRKYLQLRIEALQKLADAGDEDAQRTVKMYQAALDTLSTKKPVNSLKGLADKAVFNTIKKGFQAAGMSAEEADKKTVAFLGKVSEKAAFVAGSISDLQSVFGGLNENIDTAMETVGNIANGFATGGLVGGAMAVIGEGMKIFASASAAAKEHQKALNEIAQARIASQRAYNLLLLEQNLLLKEAITIFGEKEINRATNAMQSYRDALSDVKKEIQGDFVPDADYQRTLEKNAASTGVLGRHYSQKLQEYQKQVEAYNSGVAGLASAEIITGHKKGGFLRKGKDIYSSILDEYDDILTKEGELNVERVKNIIATRQMSDETKNYLQNLVDLQEHAATAQQQLRDYLQGTFGTLGSDIMNSLESAIVDKGINAWESFGQAGAKVLEQLGKQIAHELFFAEKFAKLQNQLEGIYSSSRAGESENQRAERVSREAADLIGVFYQNIGSDMELAQGFMENWKKEAEKYNLELWPSQNEGGTQKASTGKFESIDQDTGNRLDGRFAALQMSGLRIEAFMSDLTVTGKSILNSTISINSELQKQTNLFTEIKTIQLNSFYEAEKATKFYETMSTTLERIDKNTGRI